MQNRHYALKMSKAKLGEQTNMHTHNTTETTEAQQYSKQLYANFIQNSCE